MPLMFETWRNLWEERWWPALHVNSALISFFSGFLFLSFLFRGIFFILEIGFELYTRLGSGRGYFSSQIFLTISPFLLFLPFFLKKFKFWLPKSFPLEWFGYLFVVLPFVAFEILQFDSQRIIFSVGQHVNVFISQPEFVIGIAESALVIVPVSVEILSVVSAVIVSPLNHLITKYNNNNMISDFKHFLGAWQNREISDPSKFEPLFNTHTKATIEKTHNQILSVRNPFEEE